ncbi:hypothetical protein [Paraflavitalea sp. CAU 1676]|uniref:hypothetical protein n=1 Tax=Paraflavitalea sp. CAU 1676 TaxID=3032598 RepID=UPI0023DA2093|nr:hypothetical protein [Paraflavitalea sp. CAU 1676]MDF2187068.1 hypothetical protein [Paraflavitalea sp. CAU 1676]
MSFTFSNKVIYLLSPERWGAMRISKHHYAIELAERGNTVYFIEPPDLSHTGITVSPSGEHDSLFIVKYKPLYRGKRFLPTVVYRWLLQVQIRSLERAIGRQPNVVWCFDPYRFLNLKWFRASVTIFFAADLFSHAELPEEALTADICLGVSDTIVETLKRGARNVHFVNHGLNRFFVQAATTQLEQLAKAPEGAQKPITAGYVGNLLMEAPDRERMRQVITAHPDVRFVFWGQYEKGGNIGSFEHEGVTSFVKFLKAQPNVVLRGAVHPSVLSEECRQADVFWICWQLNLNKMWDGSNSHKILEYLSTGKPVVSHYMSTYKGTGLIDMLASKDNQDFAALFAQVINRVKTGEQIDKQRERIQFSISNAYQSHISNIESLVQGHHS